MNKFLKILLTINSINVVADYLLIPIFALFVDNLNDGAQVAGILFAVQFISSAVFSLFIVRLKDKEGLDGKLLEIDLLIKTLSWTILIFSQNIITLVIVQILIGISRSFGGPAYQALISEHLDENKHISDWSIFQLAQNIAVAVGSILSGFIFTKYGFSYLFAVMAVLEASALILHHYYIYMKKN